MKKLLLVLIVCVFALTTFASYVDILFVNDTHGHAWTFDSNIGGFNILSTVVSAARMMDDNVLFLHAGDLNTGVPESDLNDAAPDILSFNMMKLDAMTLGNHEFDNPESVLETQMELAYFPFISANIYKDGKPAFQEYIIKEFGDLKVAIFGLTAEETQILEKLYAGEYEWKNAVDVAKKLVPELKEKADIVIALTHLGSIKPVIGTSSVMLAEEVEGIDVIVDGHSHTLMEEPMKVNDTLIVSAGEWAKYLGMLQLETTEEGINVLSYELFPIRSDLTNGDYDVEVILDYFEKLGGEKLDQVLANSKIYLDGERADVRSKDTNLGFLIADALKKICEADIALTNSGGIRASINAGDITYKDILTVLPFGNTAYTIEVPGSVVKDMLDFTATVADGKGARPQVSGITYTINRATQKAENILINGEPLDMNKTYKLGTNNYIASGGDGYSMLEGLPGYDTGFVLAQVVVNYIKDLEDYSPYTDINNRITVIE
ncbi:MAG: 5-nucleotidase / UDP-sugar diphosphatase [Kosmotogales bacterium]|nr:5-nucleotidase / UDP-sugar diphosphatase [Kosmotogales bacterium]